MTLKRGEKIGCAARVKFTVEYACGAWSADCPLSQVYEQAGKEAVTGLERVLNNARLLGQCRVVGVPVVQAVMTTNYTEKELSEQENKKGIIELIGEVIRKYRKDEMTSIQAMTEVQNIMGDPQL